MKKPGGKFLWGFFDLRVQETEPFLFNQNNWSFSHLLNVQLPSPFLLQLAKCGMYHDLGILNRGYPKMDCFWFISPSKKNIPHIPLGNSPMFTCTFCQVIWRQPKISHAGPGSLGIRPNPNRGLETCHHPVVPTSKSRSTRQKQRRFWEFGQAKARCFRKAWKIIKRFDTLEVLVQSVGRILQHPNQPN